MFEIENQKWIWNNFRRHEYFVKTSKSLTIVVVVVFATCRFLSTTI